MSIYRKKRTQRWLATTTLAMSAVGAIQASAQNLTAGDFDLTKQATAATFPVMFERPTGINAAAIAGAVQQLGSDSELYKSAVAAVPELASTTRTSTLLNDALGGNESAKATIVKLINWYNSLNGSVPITTQSGAAYTTANLDQPISVIAIGFANNGQNATVSTRINREFSSVRSVNDVMTKLEAYKTGVTSGYKSAFKTYADKVYAPNADIAALSTYSSVKSVLDNYETMYNDGASAIRETLLRDSSATEAAVVFFESAVLTGGMDSSGGTTTTTPSQTFTTRFVDDKGNVLSPNETGDKFVESKTFNGYILTKTETSGTTRTYTYSPVQTSATRWVSDKGETLKPESEGLHPDLEGDDIPGYVLIKRETTTENGKTVVVNTYHKVVEVTKWQLEDGTPLKDNANGTFPDKEGDDIPNHTIVSSQTTTSDVGDKTTINVYRKTPTTPDKPEEPKPVVKNHTFWFDEEGTSLKDKTEGQLPDKEGDDISGYTLVRYHQLSKADAEGAFKGTGIVEGDVVNIYRKTPEQPTPEKITTKWVTTEGASLKEPVEGAFPDKEGDDIPNYRLVRVDTDAKGNVTNVYKLVTTRYVDPNGKDLIPPKDGTHEVVNIPGYVFTETKTPDGNTVHIYRPNTTAWIDETGKELKPTVEGQLPDKEGDDVPGYTLVETKVASNGDVVNIYKLAPKPLKTTWVDINGKVFKEAEGTHPDEDGNDISGYELVSIKRDDAGNVINIYQPIVITTKWVDVNGKELQPSKEGAFPDNDGNSDIVGYALKEVKTDGKGNVINVYEQIKGEVITHFVDEEGNRLDDDIKAETFADKKNIQGYEYIRTVQSRDGKEVFHVYRKVAESTVTPSTPVKVTGSTATLPQTGGGSSVFMAIGGFFAGLGGLLGFKRRKQSK